MLTSTLPIIISYIHRFTLIYWYLNNLSSYSIATSYLFNEYKMLLLFVYVFSSIGVIFVYIFASRNRLMSVNGYKYAPLICQYCDIKFYLS